jgi:hypothetical protein
MILMAEVAISSSRDGDRGGDNRNGSGRNSVDWEVEWIRGTDSEETMSAVVELGTGVTADIKGTVSVFLFFY